MGNTTSKEIIKEKENENTKKEYFQAIRTDMKKTINQINTLIHIESDSKEGDDTWVNFTKNKLKHYFQKNKNKENFIKEILLYMDNLEETHESKHIYNLKIFIKKSHNESLNKQQSNSK